MRIVASLVWFSILMSSAAAQAPQPAPCAFTSVTLQNTFKGLAYPAVTTFTFSQTADIRYASIAESTRVNLGALQATAASLFATNGGMTAVHNAQDCQHRIVDLTYGLYPQPPGALFSVKMSPQFWLCVSKPCPVFPNNMARMCLDPVSVVESGHAELNVPFTLNIAPGGSTLNVATGKVDAFAHISQGQQLFTDFIGGLLGSIAGPGGALVGAAAFNKIQTDAIAQIQRSLSSFSITAPTPTIPTNLGQGPLYNPTLTDASMIDDGGGVLGLLVDRQVKQMKVGTACFLQAALQQLVPPPAPAPAPVHAIHPVPRPPHHLIP